MTAIEILRKAFLGPVYLYRWLISPVLPDSCRFSPTCSQYCLQAVMRHGIFVGSFLTAFRILRCNPFGGFGSDPVPEKGEVLSYLKSFFVKKK